jgi:ABC-2 type transport system permease protein
MNNLIRSELLKQRTLRLPLIALAAAAIAGALTAIAIITTAGHAGNPPLDHHSLTQLVHGPFAIVAGAALLLGILGTAGEFRHETITSTLLVAPRRGRLLTAKVFVHAGLGAGLAVVACAVNLAVSIPWLASHDVPLAGPTDVPRVVAGSVAAAALFGAAGAGLGALLANQTTAVTVSLVWLLAVEGLVVNITSTSTPTLHDRLPGGALGVIARGAGEAHTPLWAAAGCAVAYAGALVAAGTRRLIDRDVT